MSTSQKFDSIVETGKAVKSFLKENHISVNQLAEDTHILANNISRCLSGKHRFPKRVTKVLVEKYGFDNAILQTQTRTSKKTVVNLRLDNKDCECLRLFASLLGIQLNQLITEAIYEKYGSKINEIRRFSNEE